MLCEQHLSLTDRAAQLLSITGENRAALLRGSTFPDQVPDLRFRTGGHQLLGHNLASLTHFCVPVGGGRYQGWCWKVDPGTRWIDLVDRDISCDVDGWLRAVKVYGCDDLVLLPWVNQHPQVRLDDVGGYSTALDETTFAGAHSMAEWIWILARKEPVGTRRQALRWFLAGCLAHLVQDQLVPYHSNGWMLWRPRSAVRRLVCLRGPTHAEYEARCLADWHGLVDHVALPPSHGAVQLRLAPRAHVERAATRGAALRRPRDTNELAWEATVALLDDLRSNRIG